MLPPGVLFPASAAVPAIAGPLARRPKPGPNRPAGAGLARHGGGRREGPPPAAQRLRLRRERRDGPRRDRRQPPAPTGAHQTPDPHPWPPHREAKPRGSPSSTPHPTANRPRTSPCRWVSASPSAKNGPWLRRKTSAREIPHLGTTRPVAGRFNAIGEKRWRGGLTSGALQGRHSQWGRIVPRPSMAVASNRDCAPAFTP